MSVRGRYANSKGFIDLGSFLENLAKEFNDPKLFKDAVFDWLENDLTPKLKENSSGGVLKKKTGKLSESIWARPVTTAIKGKLSRFTVKAKNVPYAAIQELGDTIVPKAGRKFLSIPLTNSPAYLKSLEGKKVSPLDYKGRGFFRKSRKTGSLLFFERSGKKIIPQFVLKDQVIIKPTHWIRKSIVEATGELYMRMLLEKNLNGLFAK